MGPWPATSSPGCCPSASGSSAPSTQPPLAARANLANWTWAAGDAGGARDQFAALAPIQERVLGQEHPDTLATRHDLAYLTGEAGDAAGARDQYAGLLPIVERVLGAEDPATLATRDNLATWTWAAGDAGGARDQFAALLPIEERVLGAEDPDTLATRNNLATWTGAAGMRPAAGSTGRRESGERRGQAAIGPQTLISAGALRVGRRGPAGGKPSRALVFRSRCRSRSTATRRRARPASS